MYQAILLGLGFFVLVVGSLTDLKKREVPDWVNYGLILSALSLRGIYSIYLSDYNILIYGLVGLSVMFLLACLMFYTGQWGGGDAKLLMGIGAVFGISLNLEFQTLFLFLINLIIFGSIYGLIWTFYLFVKNWSKTKHKFLTVLGSKKATVVKIPLYILCLILLIGSYFIIEMRYSLILLAIMLPLIFYVWAFSKVVESVTMLKKISPSKLTEGDWIAEDIIYRGKRITGPKDLGISLKQIKILNQLHQKGKIDTVLVKEGIPFVPSFLIAFVVTLLVGNWILLLL